MKHEKQIIKQKMAAEGRTIASWCRWRGHKVSTVHMILDGKRNLESYASRAILADLRKDGYLEDEPPKTEDQAA